MRHANTDKGSIVKKWIVPNDSPKGMKELVTMQDSQELLWSQDARHYIGPASSDRDPSSAWKTLLMSSTR